MQNVRCLLQRTCKWTNGGVNVRPACDMLLLFEARPHHASRVGLCWCPCTCSCSGTDPELHLCCADFLVWRLPALTLSLLFCVAMCHLWWHAWYATRNVFTCACGSQQDQASAVQCKQNGNRHPHINITIACWSWPVCMVWPHPVQVHDLKGVSTSSIATTLQCLSHTMHNNHRMLARLPAEPRTPSTGPRLLWINDTGSDPAVTDAAAAHTPAGTPPR